VSAHLAVGFVEILGCDVGHEVDLLLNSYELDAGPGGASQKILLFNSSPSRRRPGFRSECARLF
jgi:hypothetical protein